MVHGERNQVVDLQLRDMSPYKDYGNMHLYHRAGFPDKRTNSSLQGIPMCLIKLGSVD